MQAIIHFSRQEASPKGGAVDLNALHIPRQYHDWDATFTIDLTASRTENRVVVRFDGVNLIG